MSASEHKAFAPSPAAVRVGIVTVSDSRTTATNEGGRVAREICRAAGFQVADEVIEPDEPERVSARVRGWAASGRLEAILLTGGTGISRRDTTAEAVTGLFDKPIPGYGELFRWLSYSDIGAAAMLSRASAGTVGAVAVFTMPGSPAGVRLALDKLIVPELPHVVSELRRHAGSPKRGHRDHHHDHDHDDHHHHHHHDHDHDHHDHEDGGSHGHR
jgi:molybdenum cofactor biosynthesis protein B